MIRCHREKQGLFAVYRVSLFHEGQIRCKNNNKQVKSVRLALLFCVECHFFCVFLNVFTPKKNCFANNGSFSKVRCADSD